MIIGKRSARCKELLILSLTSPALDMGVLGLLRPQEPHTRLILLSLLPALKLAVLYLVLKLHPLARGIKAASVPDAGESEAGPSRVPRRALRIITGMGLMLLILLLLILGNAFWGWLLPGGNTSPLPSWEGLPFQFLLAAQLILAVLFEEIFFRGYLISAMKELGTGSLRAVLYSALLFVPGHGYLGAAGLAFSLSSALILGLVRERYGSLLPGIGAHMLYNYLILSAAGYF